MADARIRVELTAEDAKRKLKDYERGKKKAKAKAEKAEQRSAKEKGRKAKVATDKPGGLLGALSSANVALRSPKAALVSGAAQRLGGAAGGVAKALGMAKLAYDTAQAANSAAIMLGGAIKEQGGIIGKLVGAPITETGKAIQETVFDQAGKFMEAARITAQSQVSFAKARIDLSPEALVGIAEFAFAEGGRRKQIETREREETGAMVSQVISQMTGWGG